MANAPTRPQTFLTIKHAAPVAVLPNTAEVRQTTIGISLGGQTNFVSFGFSGCLGVTVSPCGRPGGLLAHVFQTGNRDGKGQEYFLDATRRVLALARTFWPSETFHVVLSRGPEPGDWALAGALGQELDIKLENPRETASNHRLEGAAFLDTSNKRAYFDLAIPTAQTDGYIDGFDVPNVITHGEIDLDGALAAPAYVKLPYKIYS